MAHWIYKDPDCDALLIAKPFQHTYFKGIKGYWFPGMKPRAVYICGDTESVSKVSYTQEEAQDFLTSCDTMAQDLKTKEFLRNSFFAEKKHAVEAFRAVAAGQKPVRHIGEPFKEPYW